MPKLVEPSVSVHPLETLGQTSTRDQSVLSQLEELVTEKGHPLRHVLALWPCYVQRVNLTRFLAHYELFKHIIDLPSAAITRLRRHGRRPTAPGRCHQRSIVILWQRRLDCAGIVRDYAVNGVESTDIQ